MNKTEFIKRRFKKMPGSDFKSRTIGLALFCLVFISAVWLEGVEISAKEEKTGEGYEADYLIEGMESNDREEKKTKYYVSLGDSIAEGTALPNAKEQCYASLIGKELDGKLAFVNYGVAMKTSTDLLDWLENIGEEERKQLLNAGVVTVSIGSNDVLLPFIYYVPEVFECDWDGLEDAIKRTIFIGGKEGIEKRIERMKMLLEEDVNRKDGMYAGFKTLRKNLPVLVKKLREMAPEAEIYFANYYNPYEGVSILDFNMGELAEQYISSMNELWEGISGDYTLIDVHSMLQGKKGILNVNILTGQFDPHPNTEGHKLLCALYLEKLQNGSYVDKTLYFRKGNLFYRVCDKKGTKAAVYQRIGSKKSVTIPKRVSYGGVSYKVAEIDKSAFYGQDNLKKVIIKSSFIKKIEKQGFDDTDSGLKVYVPKKQYKAYKKMLKGAGVKGKKVVKL